MPKRSNFGTEATLDKIYPLVESALSTRLNQWRGMISRFIEKRSSSLFDIAPCDRIYYTDNDRDDLFSALNISQNEVRNALKDAYYYGISAFNPSQAKDPTTIVVLCIVRYFFLKKKEKELDLAMIYQSFSGKYYPSIHYGFFKTVAPSKYRHIMEYVINHKLSNKFDIKSKGSVIGAVKSINNTWITAYKKQITDFDDEDIVYVIQQLHNRIKSFMKNIASLYYEAYEQKSYISYDSDNITDSESGGGDYHLTTNDSFKMQQCIENTMTRLTTSHVDYTLCKACADSNIKPDEIRGIMESIFEDSNNMPKIREYLELIISSFLVNEEIKTVNSTRFIKYVTKPKPNSKDPMINRMKEIIEDLLDDYSVGFRKRKHRVATKQSYLYAFNMYMAINVIRANPNA